METPEYHLLCAHHLLEVQLLLPSELWIIAIDVGDWAKFGAGWER